MADWQLSPAAAPRRVSRQYRGDSLLETVFECDDGDASVIDCMPPRGNHLDVVRGP